MFRLQSLYYFSVCYVFDMGDMDFCDYKRGAGRVVRGQDVEVSLVTVVPVVFPRREAFEMKIARVFPSKTSMTPTDLDAYFDAPGLFTPDYDEVHISTVFTWDKLRAEWLAKQWASKGKVILGGPAYDDPGNEFVAGRYLRHGITITSRGCPNNCGFCYVPKREGKLRELPIVSGNIIQDNNILACSRGHLAKVFDMLKTQKAIEFKGGLESARVTSEIAENLRSLRIKTLWLACDTPNALKPLKKAVQILTKAGFSRNHLFCFVLIGKDQVEEETRLLEVWNIGCMPFAPLYRDDKIQYSKEWKQFQRLWSRPAIIRSRCKSGGCF